MRLSVWKRIGAGVLFLTLVSFFFPFQSSAEIGCRQGETQEACRARLIQEKKKLEEEVKRLEQGIKKEDARQTALSREIRKFNAEILKTAQAILRKERLLSGIRSEIASREEKIQSLNEKLKREKESLKRILRRKQEIGDITILEFLFSRKTLSDFYNDLPLFSYIQKSLIRSFHEIDRLKREILQEKKKLEEKKEEHANEKYNLSLEKSKLNAQKKDRDLALRVSRSKEATLAQLKKQREEEIKRIRDLLIQFQGSGIRSKPIRFGEAYDYAKLAERKTGVRAAFILAIMQQETNLGQNLGGCYVTDAETGDGVGIDSGLSYEKVMGKGSLPHFLRLTQKLGLNWRKTPVSCPIDIKRRGSARFYYPGRGYGGAMGYTQFIPSTWVLIEDAVKRYLGISVPNPWNPRDAVMATAEYLRRLGGVRGGEIRAACSYYGTRGSTCYYGRQVMARTEKMQSLIDRLERD